MHWYLLKLLSRTENDENTDVWPADICQIWEIFPLVIPNQISTILIYIPNLVKIHSYLLKLSSVNENMDMWRAGNSIKNWWNLVISNPKPDLHNINAHTNLVKIHWCLHKLSSWKEIYRWTEGHMTDGRTEKWTSNVKPQYPASIVWRGIMTKKKQQTT